MINTSKIIIFSLSVFLSSCSQVLQTIDLKVNTTDKSPQEEFNVVAKSLTIKIAKQQTTTPYKRTVLQNGRGSNAKSIPEKLALMSKFPEAEKSFRYKIGIGDVLTYSRLIDNNLSLPDQNKKWPTQPSPATYKLGIGDTS